MPPEVKRPALTPDDVRSWTDVLLDAFNYQEFRRAIYYGTGRRIEREVNIRDGDSYIFQAVLELAVRGGWFEALVRALRKDNPENGTLRDAAEAIGIEPAPPAVPDASEQGALEKLVRARSPFVNLQEFIARLSAVGSRMCRIEVDGGTTMGTGWLVGPDLVLTNYHVIEEVHQTVVKPDAVACRFDFAADTVDTTNTGKPGDGGAPIGTLASDWLLAHSPYSEVDITGGGDPKDDELDYAVLRLSKPLGEEAMATGRPRHWLELTSNPPAVGKGDILLVSQHARGRPLELTFGQVLGFNGNATRIRHDANAEQGSSGSPCFTIALNPVGLHHASGPGKKFRYNQCIPIRRVIDHLMEQGIAPFWKDDHGVRQ
jgi:S1-C subfamily serine protease